jgi:prepilin peptidase CpaA
LFIVSLCGLVLGLTVLGIALFHRRGWHLDRASLQSVQMDGVPYGVPLAIGGVAAVWLPVLTALQLT